jgi:hypothetical protein
MAGSQAEMIERNPVNEKKLFYLKVSRKDELGPRTLPAS